MTRNDLTPEEENQCRDVIAKYNRYNGWTNYETWALALWLDNEQQTSNRMYEKAKQHLKDAPTHEYIVGSTMKHPWTVCEVARMTLADDLKEMVEKAMPTGMAHPGNVFDKTLDGALHDILNANVTQIEWGEMAEHYLEEYGCAYLVDGKDVGRHSRHPGATYDKKV